jgi:CheY-specific phosphatase CheX
MNDPATNAAGDAALRDVVDAVTAAFLGLHAEPRSIATPLAWPPNDGHWTGCVAIGGAWRGAVTIACAPEFAREAARRIFDTDIGPSPEEAARDALAELTNVVGGNIKSLYASLLGDICQLSLPVVATGPLDIPDAKTVLSLWFSCADQVMEVSVLESRALLEQRPTLVRGPVA